MTVLDFIVQSIFIDDALVVLNDNMPPVVVKNATIVNVSLLLCLIGLLLFYNFRSRKAFDEIEDFKAKLRICKDDISQLITSKNCHPLFLRLAWSDAASFDPTMRRQWPDCGGTNACIRFDSELLNNRTNAGLSKAILMLTPIYNKFDGHISWADIIQMSGALAVELAGGPSISMVYGRVDAATAPSYPLHSRLPCPFAPYPDHAPAADVHVRQV